ncbi:hypothetical protein SSOG_09092 [Streptomyces himastatinicus ATCC 53653]|uniref:Uncharacterized protein n=1 Tax=Streptomyces himastatinicus ATCC 53653 TaxID=457427 RepID=D9WWV0_9ACTN|nr:hypothetical protein [Streptomyces himastatinicus]EFL29378.1 hypothetical protein SSOG_09092 [Streptomyces himastatinicus ATCC 53653]
MTRNRPSNGWFDSDTYRQLSALTAALLIARHTGGTVQEAAAILAIGRLLPPTDHRGPDRPAV